MARLGVIIALAAVFLVAAVQAAQDVESFALEGVTWTVHKAEGTDKRSFFFNTATQKSQYNDPRKDPASDRDRLVVLLVFALPFLLLLAGGGAYLLYLKVYKPEVLKPKKKKAATLTTKGSTSPAKGKPTTPQASKAAAGESKKTE